MNTYNFYKLLKLAVVVAVLALAASCNRLNYVTYEDGEWDATDFNDEVIYNLSEFETDDLDRQ